VTGAGSGIGFAVASALAGNGWTVVLCGRRLEPLAAAARECGPGALAVGCDVGDEGSVDRLFERIETELGRLDLLFNNAGIASPRAPLEAVSLEDFRSVVDTNLTGAFLCTRAAFRLMKSQRPRGGRIINNGSISAHAPRPHMIAYTASKHAVTGLTRSTALEGRECDIACGQIDIGNTATQLVAPMSEPTFEVKHVADAVLYMAGLPLAANVLFMTVMATRMPYVGRG
jgi:NAD(P)-dependent dehydrogenase (short-subunit alcohol dehydrogenase family)